MFFTIHTTLLFRSFCSFRASSNVSNNLTNFPIKKCSFDDFEHSFALDFDMKMLGVKNALIFILILMNSDLSEETSQTSCNQSLMVALKSVFESASADDVCVSFSILS